MTRPAHFQPGSFRGAGFVSEAHEGSGGRRLATFEFPGRDVPLVEDLGRKSRKFSLDCLTVGADYHAKTNALLDALEAAGPGLLVHPWRGSMMAVVEDYLMSEDQSAGVATFRISFAEAGQPVTAPLALPAGQLAGIEAAGQAQAMPAMFARRFSIDGAAGFVEAAAGTLISGMVNASALAAGLQGGIGPALRAFDAGLRYLPANLGALLRAPVNLAHAIIGLVAAVSALNGSARSRAGYRSRIAALSRMAAWQPDEPSFPVITESRRREAANRTALLWLFHSAAAGELAQAAAEAPYASYDDAVSTRDTVAGLIDALALAAADGSSFSGAGADDELAEGFDRLRRAMVRDVTARGATLARLTRLELAATEPALVIANRIYGSAGVGARADDIAARNRLVHPGFAPGGQAIDLLTVTTGLAA